MRAPAHSTRMVGGTDALAICRGRPHRRKLAAENTRTFVPPWAWLATISASPSGPKWPYVTLTPPRSALPNGRNARTSLPVLPSKILTLAGPRSLPVMMSAIPSPVTSPKATFTAPRYDRIYGRYERMTAGRNLAYGAAVLCRAA